MKNVIKVILVLFWVNQAAAQQISWVNRLYGNENSPVVEKHTTSNGYISVVNFKGSAQLHSDSIVRNNDSATSSFNSHRLIGFVDTAGVVSSKFMVEGSILRMAVLNDSEFVSLSPVYSRIYVDGVLKLDSTGYGSWGFGLRLLKFTRTGEVTLLHEFPLWSNSHDSRSGHVMSMVVTENKQNVVILFESIMEYDTLLMDTGIVKNNQALIVSVNIQSHQITYLRSCPPLFSRINTLPQSNKVLLMGVQIVAPLTYELNGTSYTHTSDTVKDVVLASYDLDSGTFDWHKVMRVECPSPNGNFDLVTVGDRAYSIFGFADTLSVDGQAYGAVIPFNTIRYDAVVCINPEQGAVHWVRLIKGIFIKTMHAPYNSLFDGVSLDFYASSDVSIDNMPVPKMAIKGENYLRIGVDGALAQSLNYTFIPNQLYDIPVLVNEQDSTVILFVELQNAKPIVLNGNTYERHDLALTYSDYLAVKFKSTPSSDPSSVTEWSEQMATLSMYPNPCKDFVYLTGFANSDVSARIDVYDITGRLVFTQEQKISSPLDMGSVPKGLYMVQVNHQGQLYQMRLLKD